MFAINFDTNSLNDKNEKKNHIQLELSLSHWYCNAHNINEFNLISDQMEPSKYQG